MTPFPVVGGVETGEAFVEGHLLACVCTSGVCHVHWAPPAWFFSECVVTWSGYIGRMSFPFPSIRREASVNCGTPDNGRCKQTPCKGENRHMNFADMEECARGAGSGEAIPHSPLTPVERCPDRADPLASLASSHIRIAPGGSY